MAIDYNKLREILERKANRAIGYLDELKCFVPEFREVLDSVLYISETLKDLTFLDTECPDCKKEKQEAPKQTGLDRSVGIGQKYHSLSNVQASDYIVLFYSDGCEPCQKKKPITLAVANELNIPVELVSVDTEIGENHARNFGVQGWPTIFIIKNNEIIDNIPGYNMQVSEEENKAQLKNTVRAILGL